MSKLKKMIEDLAEKEGLNVTITESEIGVMTIEHTPVPNDVQVHYMGVYHFVITNHERKVPVTDLLLEEIKTAAEKYLDGLKTEAQ